jgi:AhpD family alkylhydroperoxidase
MRYNLSQEPKAFAEDSMVRELLHERGDGVLPVVRVDGELRSSGRYPTRDELDVWTGAGDSNDLDAATAELVALGAAVGANCETCLKFHFNKARLLGVSTATMSAAIRIAQSVKEAPATSIQALAAKLLGTTPDALSAASLSANYSSETVSASSQPEQTGAAAPCCSPTSTEASSPSTPEETVASSSCCGGSETDDRLVVGVKAQGSACCG